MWNDLKAWFVQRAGDMTPLEYGLVAAVLFVTLATAVATRFFAV